VDEPEHVRTTRDAYDVVAADYAEMLHGALDAQPLDRALLHTFAELVRDAGGGPVLDVGCGPGRITAYLHGLALDVSGADLSLAMVREAQQRVPALHFEAAELTALDVPDASLAGLVAWYSIIHTPPAELPAAFAEFARVVRPGGKLLLAFQATGATTAEAVQLDRPYGHDVELTAYRLPPEQVVADLSAAGMTVTARLVREPTGPERTPQAYLLAERD
jgi:ubiquinone/menaquinone biosynthesis C-methylase UbiE